MELAITHERPSISMDELWEASPCNWCLLAANCCIYCDAKTDWLRIFYGQDTYEDLREFFRIHPTTSLSTVTISYGSGSSTKIKRDIKDGSSNSEQMRGLSRKGKLFRGLRRRINKGIKSLL